MVTFGRTSPVASAGSTSSISDSPSSVESSIGVRSERSLSHGVSAVEVGGFGEDGVDDTEGEEGCKGNEGMLIRGGLNFLIEGIRIRNGELDEVVSASKLDDERCCLTLIRIMGRSSS